MLINKYRLEKSKWVNLVRLAKWKGYKISPGPENKTRKSKLINVLNWDMYYDSMIGVHVNDKLMIGNQQYDFWNDYVRLQRSNPYLTNARI